MPTIYDLVEAPIMASYYNTMSQDRAPFLGEALFPNRKKLGLDLAWIKGAAQTPVVLRPSAFDVEVTPRPRIGLDEFKTEMPFFKESKRLNEYDRQELNKVMEHPNPLYRDEIINRIFDDNIELLDAARVQRERMRMSLLTSGMISIASNGVNLEYDYGMPSDHKITVTNKWNVPETSNPFADIQAAQDVIEDEGNARPTRMLMNRYTWRLLFDSKAIKSNAYVMTNGVGFINDADMRGYLMTQLGVTAEIYNKSYMDEKGTKHKYIPDGTVVLLPGGTLGTTWFGTTPEESDLMTGSAANVAIVDTGVAITTMKRLDPVNVETKVSMISLPSFEMADQIAILDVI